MGLLVDSWWPVDWVIPVILLVTLVYVYLTWNYDYWKKRGIPYSKPSLVLGGFMDSILGRKSLGEVYQDIYRELEGHKYGGFYKFREPALIIRDPDLIKSVLVKDFTSFHDNDIVVDEKVDPLFYRNPFVLPGEKWKKSRSQLTPAFTPGKVKPLFPLMTEVCKELTLYLEQEGSTGSLEAKELAAKYTTDVVGTCTFGINCNSFKDPNAEFRQIGRKLLAPTFWKNMQFLMLLLMPGLSRIFRVGLFPKDASDFFWKVVREVASHRDRNNVTRNDFMQLLIEMRRKGDATPTNADNYSEEDMVGHATVFFTEGFETSSAVLSFTLFELAVNPEVQQRLREEVDSMLQQHDGKLDYDAINNMVYLDMVLAEAMRVHPPATSMARVCTQPFDLPTPSGRPCRVEVGTPVVIPVYALHHDPQLFPSPEKFDPERFSEENKAAVNRFAYLPFGEGPRICIGSRFAFAQVKAGLVTIISNFDVKLCKKSVVPITPDPYYFLLAAKDGLWLDFVKRTDR